MILIICGIIAIALEVNGQTVHNCFIPSDPNGAVPRPKTINQLLVPGPPGSSCSTIRAEKCDNSSCPYGFDSNSAECSCKCFDPCASRKCNSSEECVVMHAPDNLFYGMCIQKPDLCPKMFCGIPECKYGYVTGSDGCPTCECKDPCLNFGCPIGYTCQMLRLINNILEPTCVACGKMDCPKIGVCPNGLAKDMNGCDTCECHGCMCDDCFGQYCPDHKAMNETTGCDICLCETSPCLGKCANDEKCEKKHTKHGRVYGICEKKVETVCKVNCSSNKCPYGLKIDSFGCHLPGCPCHDPCERMSCGLNEICKMTPDDCTSEDCRDAPMPYCDECPSLSGCTLNCTTGMARGLDGCPACKCMCQDLSGCPLHCKYGFEIDPNTGCEECYCNENPCEKHRCNISEDCVVKFNGTIFYAGCNPKVPVDPCEPVSCDHVDCFMGLERDSRGCVLPNCTCFDWCKNYKCPPGEVCKITKNDCKTGSDCRDLHLRYCEAPSTESPVSVATITTVMAPITTAATSPTATTKERDHQCPSATCDSRCTSFVNSSDGCRWCNCTGVDPCQGHRCPAGQICFSLRDSCRDAIDCIGSPICVDEPTTTTRTTTTWPIHCTIPLCHNPCTIVSRPGLACLVCECPSGCQNATCPTGETCRMLSHGNCFPPCPQIPRCVQSQPSFCFEAVDEGRGCLDVPILQYYYDSVSQICKSFWFKGCQGNENRFSSMASCKSICFPQTYECPMFGCQRICHHGYKVDGFGCRTCQCIDICEEVLCPSANQMCRTFATPCNGSGACTPTEFSKCVCLPTSCQVTCPFGKVKDSQGCTTCECYDPCKLERCPSGQLCQIVEYQKCNDKSCSSAHLGTCLDAFLKRNIKIKINASYDMYVLGDLDSLISQVTNQLSSIYRVKRDFVSITKIENGSILMTANVIYSTSEQYLAKDDQGNFTIKINNVEYPAVLISTKDETPLARTPTSNRPYLTQEEIKLIVLLSVIVPLATIVTVVVCYFVYVHCKRRQAGMKLFSNTSSESLKASTMPEESNVWASRSSIGFDDKDSINRPVSYTEA